MNAAALLLRQDEPGGGHLQDFLDALNEFYRKALLLPEQASTIARPLDSLHFFEITVMFAVATVIAVVALSFIVRYRRGPGREPTPRIAASRTYEFALYCGLFGLFVLFWVIGFRQYAGMVLPPEDALDVYVTAKQWTWKFAYPEGPASAGILYVPAGRPVRLHLTSRDVIHSFFVPAFRIKRDAVPGTYTTAWFQAVRPGRYPILCTEFCGTGHSMMRGEVVVLDAADYGAWLNGRPPAVPLVPDRPYLEEPSDLGPLVRLAELGRAAAARHGCLKCHTIDGTPHIGPTWLHLYGAREIMADGDTITVNEAYITESMKDPQARIVAGYPPVMPSFLGQITPAETAAIIEYLKSLAGTPEVRPRNRPGAAELPAGRPGAGELPAAGAARPPEQGGAAGTPLRTAP